MELFKRVSEDGTIRYSNSKGYHREDGPAIIYTSGIKCWYKNGKLHREDGPAMLGNAMGAYYLRNKHLSKEQWEKEVLKIKLSRFKKL